MVDPTGETDKGALRLDFDRRPMLQFRGSAITSDAGLLAYRELDNTMGLTETGADALADFVTFQLTEVAVPRQMFADILMLIARLRAPPAAGVRSAGTDV
jgi:hypothetical protein